MLSLIIVNGRKLLWKDPCFGVCPFVKKAVSRIHFVASGKPVAQTILAELVERYRIATLADADYVVAVGGDGTILQALHASMPYGKPVFGMRVSGSRGLLGNILDLSGLPERLKAASRLTFHPLEALVHRAGGGTVSLLGINEIVLVRQGRQAAKLRLVVDGTELASCLTGDGVLVTLPLGSRAYNRSAGGPVLLPGSGLLALTGLLPLPSNNWSNHVLLHDAVIAAEVLEPDYRRVKVEAGQETVDNAHHVRITRAPQILTLLFDPSGRAWSRLEFDKATTSAP